MPEGLAELVPAGRRLLVFPRPATMRPLGEVWRLGVLLLDAEGRLYAAGRATRAAERGRVGYQSVSREERRELAAAALRGGYPEGAPVNFDVTPIALDDVDAAGTAGAAGAGHTAGTRGPSGTRSLADPRSPADPVALGHDPDGPVGYADEMLRVRWRAGAPLEGAPPLAQYLRERVDLLVDPPLGAT